MHNFRFYSHHQRLSGASGRGRQSNDTPVLLNYERGLSETPLEQPRAKQTSLPPPNASQDRYKPEEKIVNLQYVLTIENKIWLILECLRSGVANHELCLEYWEISEESPMPALEVMFRDTSIKKSIRKVCSLEITALGLANFCFKGDLPPDLLEHFRNLFYYIHENYLCCMKLLMLRCRENANNNTWVGFMRDTVKQKQTTLIPKGGNTRIIREHCEITVKIIEKIAEIVKGGIEHCVMTVLQEIDSIVYGKARWIFETAAATLAMPDYPIEPFEFVQETPFLPPKSVSVSEYTLVLDLDETLVHYSDAGEDSKLLIRPYATEFLQEMDKYYELVIFTAALEEYADWAISLVDPEGLISHRMYRQHTIPTGAAFVKDLSFLGRDLTKTIIVDNVSENFKMEPDNGIFMKTWIDDEEDLCLSEIVPLLREIVLKEVPDVRVALRNFRDEFLRELKEGVANPLENFQTT